MAVGTDEKAAEFDRTHTLSVVRWPLTLNSWGLFSFSGLKQYLSLFSLLSNLIRKEKITRIHCGRSIPEGVLCWLAWKLKRIPYLCYIHGEELATYQTSKELKWLSMRVFEGARMLIVNSKNTCALISVYIPSCRHKIRILNPGVDTGYFKPHSPDPVVKKRLGWDDRVVVLSVGRLQKRKGHDHTILAMEYVRERIPNILYAIIGDGKELEYLKDLTAKKNLNHSVLFMGEMQDSALLECYQQCDLFVLANREVNGDIEGFGMVLVEAQACGRPVIAGDSGGTSETMIPGTTGLIVDCRDPKILADAICSVLGDMNKSQEMGKRAREWVQNTFEWNHLVTKARDLFCELNEQKNR